MSRIMTCAARIRNVIKARVERIFARRLWLSALPWLILALGLGVTVALWQNARRDAAQLLSAEFGFWVDKIADGVDSRLNNNIQVLRGVVGLFDASDAVTRPEFQRYVAALRLAEHYPGIQGIGFSRLIPPDQKAAHEAAIRQAGFPDYAIHPPGERDVYTAVIYLEPFSGRNLRVLGYDMSSEPVRWAAALRARDENRATLSGKVTLQQETASDIQPGFVLFLPVYRRHAHDALETRRASLTGWVFSPLRMRDLMQGVLKTVGFEALQSTLDVQVYDGVHVRPDARLFALHPDATPAVEPAFRAVRRLLLGGHPWSLQVSSTPQFEARLRSEKAELILLAGGGGSLLLALLIGVLTASQKRIAAALAEANRNIVERQQVEKALQESEARFRSYFELPLVGIAVTALDKGWIDINPRLCEILDYSPEALRQKTWADLTYPDDLDADVDQFNRALAGEINGYSLEKRFVRQNGEVISAEISAACVRDAAGQPRYFVALVQDITDRKRLEAELREQAIRDPLTGLFNRRYLDETLPRELHRCQRNGKPLSAAMLDLDHFKRFNDAYGHEAGDCVLRAIGALLRCSLRADDIACRYGGEELTVILPGSTPEDAQVRLDGLRQKIMQMRLSCRESPLPAVTVSIGIATAESDETDAATLLNRADAALYQAKAQGRNRVARYAMRSNGHRQRMGEGRAGRGDPADALIIAPASQE